MKFIQLSDLHLSGTDALLYGLSPEQRLQAAVDSIVREHADAAFCVLSGDLAETGSAQAYAALIEITSRLPMPVYPMVGNHDDRATFVQCWPALHTDAAGFVQSAVDAEQGRVLLLDTVAAGHPWGEYCERRRAWLRGQLEDASVRAVYLIMHHPPLALGIPSMDQYALQNADAFHAVLAPHRAKIRHIFCGHVHRPISGSWHGIPFSVVRSPNHQVALDLHTRDKVPKCNEAPGYAVVLIDDASVVVHHYDFLMENERLLTQRERSWL